MGLETIDTLIVVMLENRSFDHMLGYLSLPGAGQLRVDGLRPEAEWRDAHANVHGGRLFRTHRLDPALQTISDPAHDHAAIRSQIETAANGGGPMGGFVDSYVARSQPAPSDPALVMGYYDAGAVPVYDFFAHNFAVCDHWFAALPAGTQPNRLMAMAGTTPLVDNADLFLPDLWLVYDWLSHNQVDWCVYHWGGFLPFFALNERFLPQIVVSLTLHPRSGRFRRYSHFAEAWASASSLPRVIFIEPEYGDGPHTDPNDDHPPTGVAKGQAFLADIYTTLISNPSRWARTMMVVTYDEHGGFFDHVPPLPIPVQIGAELIKTTGVRVPAFVVSPQVAAGSVFDRRLDHTSVLELLAEKFTPGHGYSIEVNARQGQLHRLSEVLVPPPPIPPTPQLPHALRSAIRAEAAVAAPAPQQGPASTSANARALNRAAEKALDDHPDLMAHPQWDALRRHLGR